MRETATPPPRSTEDTTVGVSAPSVPAAGSLGASSSRYVVLEEVGRGGMGRVLRAYDPKLQREVALKEVRGDGLQHAAARGLVAEARAMAMLAHPNVVAVYDVEELASGEVMVVMEYVPGQTLQAWLRERSRPYAEILARFVEAGRGLVAAHEAGLLHRDFKPANVLVADTTKVTDFGLAKPTDAEPSTHSESSSSSGDAAAPEPTEHGTVSGTPRYMAPEQHDAAELTPAADQYAFCVALWEALAGRPPFTGPALAQAKRAGPPPWPGSNVPRRIVAAIERGLAPRTDDRWPSMRALLDALTWDPARRRNRWLVAAAGIGSLGVSWAAWAQVDADRCRGAEHRLAGIWDEPMRAAVHDAMVGIDKPFAAEVSRRTTDALDAYAETWTATYAENCEATSIRGEQSAELMDLRMGCLARAATNLQATVETLGRADTEVVARAHQLIAALPPLSRCSDPEALAADVEPPLPDEAEAVEEVRLELARAKSLQHAGRYADAAQTVTKAKAAAETLAYGPVHTEIALVEGEALAFAGDYAGSEAAFASALELAARWKQRQELSDAARHLLFVVGSLRGKPEAGLRYWPLARGLIDGVAERELAARGTLATVLLEQGKVAEAEAEERAVLELTERTFGPDHLEVAASRNNLANVLFDQGDFAGAEREHRAALATRERILGPDHPMIAHSRSNLGNTLARQGRLEEAEAEQRAALAIRIASLGAEHPQVAESRNNLGATLTELGRLEEAEAEHRAAIEAWTRAVGPEHRAVGAARNNLANLLQQRGRNEEAELEHRAALGIRERALGPDHPDVAQSRNNLANALSDQGKLEEAEAEFRAALASLERSLGRDHPGTALAHDNLAALLELREAYALAEAEHRIALSIMEASLPADHLDVAITRMNLATSIVLDGRPEDALPEAEHAWQRLQRDDVRPEQRAYAAFVLATILWEAPAPTRDRPRARTLAEQALAWDTEAGEPGEAHARDVRAWLDRNGRRPLDP